MSSPCKDGDQDCRICHLDFEFLNNNIAFESQILKLPSFESTVRGRCSGTISEQAMAPLKSILDKQGTTPPNTTPNTDCIKNGVLNTREMPAKCGFTITLPGSVTTLNFWASTFDINRDGIQDLALCPPSTSTIYVVYGSTNPFPDPFDITTINGSNGFKIIGPSDTRFVSSIVATDINGDQIVDLAFSAYFYLQTKTIVYVVYGSTSPFPDPFDINTLDGSNGFKIISDNNVIISTTLDINLDNEEDLGLKSDYLSSIDFLYSSASPFPNPFDMSTLSSSNSFKIFGSPPDFGFSTANLDINKDGIKDLATSDKGSIVYLIYGSNTPLPNPFDITTLDGLNGFNIVGPDGSQNKYIVANGGDLNKDGFQDLVISSDSIDAVYVIYGSTTSFPNPFDLTTLNGSNGFKIVGSANSKLGSVIAALDINKDGITDLAICALNINTVFVIYGSITPFPHPFDITTLDGSNGFNIVRPSANYLGYPTANAGDINGDNSQDLIVGNPFESSVTVIYGW